MIHVILSYQPNTYQYKSICPSWTFGINDMKGSTTEKMEEMNIKKNIKVWTEHF